MPTVNLSPLFNDAVLDSSGIPASGYKLFTYAAGSSTKTTTYQDSAGATPHANPIVLNSRGEPPAPIWLTSGTTYKFVLASPTDTDPPSSPIRTIDNITGINDLSQPADSEWQASGYTPTYVSATSFTVVGDQTSLFHAGRRLKLTVTAGTVYGTVVSSSYSAPNATIKVKLDSGSLDSGLSAVQVGLISRSNISSPSQKEDVCSYPLALHENLKLDYATAATLTVTADKVVVKDSSGNGLTLSSVSLTANIGTAGANGLDTGSEGSSTWYYVWVIFNGTTVAALLSTSATAPTLPSGYTHKGLLGAVYNDGSSDFRAFSQRGTLCVQGSDTALSGGSATSYTSISLAASCPPLARAVSGYGTTSRNPAANNTLSIAADATPIGRVAIQNTGANTGSVAGYFRLSLKTAQTLYYTVQPDASASANITITGFEF